MTQPAVPALARRASNRPATSVLVGQARSRFALLPLANRVVRPQISVIVPFYNVEAYLAECLESILAQSFTHFEVLLVDDGSPDGSRAIAERYVVRDRRVRLITRQNGGLGAARNTGIREARGRFLTFVDSDDVLPDGALAALITSAQESGSEIVVGAFRRFDSAHTWPPRWVEAVHSDPRIATRLQEFPPILRNLYTWNKLFRRDFWTAQGLWFREGVAYEDQPIITELFARAGSIDVIPDVVYRYRQRDDRSSISQQTASLKDLRDRIAAWRVSREVLKPLLDPATYDAWLVTLFDVHFHWYLTSQGTIDDDYWAELVEVIGEFAAEAPASVWERTSPARRVLISLALAGRRAAAQEFVRRRGTQVELWPSRVTPSGVLVELPFFGDPDLSEVLFLLRPPQLTLFHAVENIHWSGEDQELACEITGRAYLGKMDFAAEDSHISVVLEHSETGVRHEFASLGSAPSTFALPMEDLWCDYEAGTFRVRIPWAQVADCHVGASWRVLLQIVTRHFDETRPMTTLLRRGSAGWVDAATDRVVGRLVVDWQVGRTVRIRAAEASAEVLDLEIHGRTAAGRLAGGAPLRRLVARSTTGQQAAATVGSDGSFELTLPKLSGPRPAKGVGSVLWTVEGGGRGPVLLSLVRGTRAVTPGPGALAEPDDEAAAGSAAAVLAETGRSGELVLRDSVHDIVADRIEEDPLGVLTITGRVLGSDRGSITLFTGGIGGTSTGPAVEVANGRFVASLPLTHRVSRFGDWALPPGSHDVFAQLSGVVGAMNGRVRVQLSRTLGAQLPIALNTEQIQGHIVRGPESSVQVHLQRPLGVFNSSYQQNRLRGNGSPRPLKRGLLLRSYFGEGATDSGVAIQAELRRRGSDLPVYWAVHGPHVPVPEGSVPVTVKSPEWFELLDSSKYYVDNMFQPEYHHKPSGQIVVQTFHGYPFKRMGIPHWRQQQFSQSRIDSYLSRIRDWDFLLSPATYATELLRRDFAFENQMLDVGYPRNDVLRSPEATGIRETVRAELGIRQDQIAVLYAPTFRDYLAFNDNRAPWAEFFDFRRAVDRLGDRFVFLIRGHAFNARVKRRVALPPGCLDVTDYPEVSDLYLAVDAAVVDYSSLRFDFAVTGKPMIFHVPDLQRYRDARGWLFDFELSAPGPRVETTDAVVEHLLDLSGVRREWATAYAAFARDYLDLDDGHAAARFVDAVFAPHGDA